MNHLFRRLRYFEGEEQSIRTLLLLNLKSLRAQYWLLPGVMALGALILGIVAVALDRGIGVKWIELVPWLYANGPTGARSLLSTIAGSMITVAGVTFSITIAALATTASTFGPRLISNFMQDRGNQITLGTFISTFLFCLVALRTVRTGENEDAVFVPHLALLIALLFVLASLGVLIYFIHHIPESIHISNVIARLGRDLQAQVASLFPDSLGEPAGEGEAPNPDLPAGFEGYPAVVRAHTGGYIQYVDTAGLMTHAKKHDLLIEMRHRPGDFVYSQRPLAWVRPQARATQEVMNAVYGAIVIGGYQSQEQDVLYLINRLVEVAARALSPGMNDLFTATNAMDWLGGGLANLGGRELPEDARRDDQGQVRVIARSRTFEEVASAVFDQLRPYAASDCNAAVHLMRTLADVASETANRERRAVLLTHTKALHHASLEALDQPRDIEAIEAAYADAIAALSVPRAGESVAVKTNLGCA